MREGKLRDAWKLELHSEAEKCVFFFVAYLIRWQNAHIFQGTEHGCRHGNENGSKQEGTQRQERFFCFPCSVLCLFLISLHFCVALCLFFLDRYIDRFIIALTKLYIFCELFLLGPNRVKFSSPFVSFISNEGFHFLVVEFVLALQCCNMTPLSSISRFLSTNLPSLRMAVR